MESNPKMPRVKTRHEKKRRGGHRRGEHGWERETLGSGRGE